MEIVVDGVHQSPSNGTSLHTPCQLPPGDSMSVNYQGIAESQSQFSDLRNHQTQPYDSSWKNKENGEP